jgi:hypothetical protein
VCVQVVEYANLLAELQNVHEIDVPLLQAAMRRGFTPGRAEALLDDSDAELSQPIVRAG